MLGGIKEEPLSDIVERVARLEDRAQLQELVVRYFLAADGDDVAGLAETFAPNGRFSISGEVGGTTREEVVAFLVAARKQMGLTLHSPTYALFTFRGPDRAEGLVGALLQLAFGDGSVHGAVRYQDEYVRVGGGWRIQSRDMRTIHVGPSEEIGRSFASATPVRWPGAPPAPSDFPRRDS